MLVRVFIIAFLLSFSSLLYAANGKENSIPTFSWEVEEVSELSSAVNRAVAPTPPCTGCPTSSMTSSPTTQSRLSCSRMADEFCTTLWNKAHRGTLEVSDGAVSAGPAKNSLVSEASLENLRALVNSYERLPKDLKLGAEPLLDRIQNLLDNPVNTRDWSRALSTASEAWSAHVEETSQHRAEKSNPNLSSLRIFTEMDREAYRLSLVELRDQVLEAKYAESENWLRVKRVFSEAKAEILSVIDSLPWTAAEKKRMRGNVIASTLTLPYQNPLKLGAKPECASTESNARYFPGPKKITVCAGYFNSYQTDINLFTTLVHELAHSVDILQLSKDAFLESSTLFRRVRPIAGMKSSSAISCQAWRSVTGITGNYKAFIDSPTPNPRQRFYDCLAPKAHLDEFDFSSVKAHARRKGNSNEMAYSAANDFSRLLNPQVIRDGESVSNEYFGRPDRVITADNNFDPDVFRTDPYYIEFFMQAHTCQSTALSEAARIRNASAEAINAVQAVRSERNNFCRTNCSDLSGEYMAASSDELLADWMSTRALGRRLARESDLRKRRELAMVAGVDLCHEPTVADQNSEIEKVEKELSREVHPSARARRIALLSANATLLECKPEKLSKPGDKLNLDYASCEP